MGTRQVLNLLSHNKNSQVIFSVGCLDLSLSMNCRQGLGKMKEKDGEQDQRVWDKESEI